MTAPLCVLCNHWVATVGLLCEADAIAQLSTPNPPAVSTPTVNPPDGGQPLPPDNEPPAESQP